MDSGDELEEPKSWKGVPATIICINVYGQQDDNIHVALAATRRMIRQSLRLSGSNFVGVCLYGTNAKKSTILGINTVIEVFPLKLPTLDDYRKLQNIDAVIKAQDFLLSEVLWYCSRAFTSCKRQFSSRNIILLSKLDVPPLQSDQNHSFKRVIELSESNIDVKFINISKDEYEVDSFYNDFMYNITNQKEDIVSPKRVWDEKEIENMLQQQSHRHLAVARLHFKIGGDLAIGVGVYSLLKTYGQPLKKTDLDRDTSAILTRVNKTTKVEVKSASNMDIDEEQVESTAVPVLKSELVYYKILGGMRVTFNDDDMKKIRNPFGNPMMQLLGFKPAAMLCKEKWFVKPCYFLFPNEDMIEGSFVAFKALHKACIETNVVAFCVLCTRVNAKHIMVALSPTTKPLGLDVDIGFDVIRVPYVENLRQLPELENDDASIPVSNEQKTAMMDILNSLQFDYKPDMFENPKVQKQYRALEAIALDEDDEEEEFIDTTKPDSSRFQELKDDLFQELFGPFGPVAVKKASTSREGGPANKKPKPDIDESLLKERLENNKIKDYTVAVLKDILYSRNLSDLPALNGLKKNELVELIYKYCK